jgi:3-methyladenine DNA glycosylase AlkD
MIGLANAIRAELTAAADSAKAPAMQAYMKSAMPYLGVTAVPLDKICKRLFRELNYRSSQDWQCDVLALWNGALFREERYAAIALTGIKAVQGFQQIDALPMYQQMIVSGAWWDYVDPLATARLGQILRHQPLPMKRTMLRWSKAANLWQRRSAILCQIKAKQQTDTAFLYACIEPSLASGEFFLRKAIGWALREYAWTDPAEVSRYVKANEGRLSGLTRREALKNIAK